MSFESSEEVEAFYLERIDMLRETFGVLLFLYSVICTKVMLFYVNIFEGLDLY